MKTRLYLFALLSSLFTFGFAQQKSERQSDTSGYNLPYWNALADKKHLNPEQRREFIEGCKLMYERSLQEHDYHPSNSELIWIPENSAGLSNGKGYSPSAVNAGSCTNIDFESGTFAGWTRSNGFNPLYNASGCCPTPNGDQTITAGAGTDPFGGFPVVYPGGGSFSVRLGSPAIGGRADRLEQTFFVTPSNANFTYRYAVVLNDGGANHTAAQQPRFTIEMIDSLGAQVPCTFYDVSAGSSITGFFTSPLQANGTAVLYKPWSSVAVDLTPNIGQNVTIRFTVFDCSLSGHFAYAYIDGVCTNFATSVADSSCPGKAYQMCGPIGFGQYIWNGPGVVNNPNQCINAVAPGVYTCQTILVPGCPGPSFTHTLTNFVAPALTFTPSTGICSKTFSFAGTSSISAGTVNSYTYTFGDNTSSNLQSPVHTYPAAGAYTVYFKGTSNRGCRDSVSQVVVAPPNPTLAFSPPSHCINTLVQFTNNSSVPPLPGVPPGTIVSYNWNLGNGQTSTITNPTSTYTNSGTFTITLTATSDQGCTATLNQTLGIFPPPVIDFSANPLCDLNGTAFMPSATSSIVSGSIVGYLWNFGDPGSGAANTSTLANPAHIYGAPGAYTITYTGTSNHNCVTTVVKSLTISPTPTVSFNTYSANACSPQFSFASTSSVSAGTISYSWNFGGSNTSTLANPSYTFPGIGTYTVRLIATSNMGCADTSFNVFTLYPYPVITVSAPAACESAIFTASATAVSGSVTSYNWNFGDPGSGAANTSTLQNPSHSYPAVGNYTLSLQVISNQNCPSNYSTQIQVHPDPVSNFTMFPPDACVTNINFVNTSTFSPAPPPSGNSIVSSLWNIAGLATSTLTSPSHTFPGPGVYTVNLRSTTNHNCTSNITKTVTIHAPPTMTISVAPACLNVAAVFNASIDIGQFPQVGTITAVQWGFGDGTFDPNQNTTHNYLTSGNKIVTFSATSNQGCLRTTSANLVIHSIPNIAFTFFNPCAGAPMIFTNTSVMSGTGSILQQYKWDFESDGITNSSQTNPATTYSPAGIYTVQLTGITNLGCRDSLSQQIIVYDVPVPVITTSDVCHGQPTPFSGTLSTPGTNATLTAFSWNFGNNTAPQNTISGSYTYPLPGQYALKLTATNNFNCSTTTTSLINVNVLPVPNFLYKDVCLNTMNSFTNVSSITPPDQIIKWRWDFGFGMVQTLGADTSKLYTFPGSYVVRLEATSNKQCVATRAETVIVHDNPQSNFTNSVICVGDKVIFNNTSSASDGTIVTSAWDMNGDSIIEEYGPTPTYAYGTAGFYPVKLTVITNYGCKTTITRTLSANPKATPAFSSDFTSGCPMLCVKFSNESKPVSGTFTSRWDFGDGTSASAATNPSHCYDAGIYNVTLELRTDSGCKSALTSNGYMNVFPEPTAAFDVTPEMVDEDDPTITVTSRASKDADFVKYFISDGATFTTPDFTHVIKNMDKKMKPLVVQTVRNAHGCSDTLMKMLEVKPTFALYVPNVFTPNSDGKNDGFQAKGVGIIKFSMQIYDRWGHLVWQTDDFADSWNGDVRGFPNTGKQDVFTWEAQVVDILNKNHNLTGHVTLLR